MFLCMLVASAMLTGAVLVAVTAWRLWYLLPAPTLTLLMTLIVLARRVEAPVSAAERSAAPPQASNPPIAAPARNFPALPMETPLPTAPALVRVLETFDLSHDPGTQEMQQPAQSEEMLDWGAEQGSGDAVPRSTLGETEGQLL
jgi:hypothetical protein